MGTGLTVGPSPAPLRRRNQATTLDSGERNDHVVDLEGTTHAATTALSALLSPQPIRCSEPS